MPPSDDATARRPRRPRGELRSALIAESFRLLSEVGLPGFSVAEIARRLQVSTAAPYRHFPDREHLLVAVAAQAAEELANAIRSAGPATENDPVLRLAATAGTYVRFVADRGAGFDVIFAQDLRPLGDKRLAEAGRDLMSLLLDLVQRATEFGPQRSLELLEQIIVLAHGYTNLDTDGFLSHARLNDSDVADRASHAAAIIIRGSVT